MIKVNHGFICNIKSDFYFERQFLCKFFDKGFLADIGFLFKLCEIHSSISEKIIISK